MIDNDEEEVEDNGTPNIISMQKQKTQTNVTIHLNYGDSKQTLAPGAGAAAIAPGVGVAAIALGAGAAAIAPGAGAAAIAPGAGAAAMKSSKPFVVLFVGEVGMGKSALINALVPEDVKTRPKSAGDLGGVTKQFHVFRIHLETFGNAYAIDCMGVGDREAKLPVLVSGIEAVMSKESHKMGLAEGSGVNAVVICIRIGGRVNIGAQVAAALLKMGIVDHDENGLKNIIVCGTMADEVGKKKIRFFREYASEEVAKYLGGEPGKIVVTGLEKEDDDEGDAENNIIELTEALEEIGNASLLSYHQPSTSDVCNILQSSTGLEIPNQEEFQRQLETSRHEMDKKMDELREQLARQNKEAREWQVRLDRERQEAREDLARERQYAKEQLVEQRRIAKEQLAEQRRIDEERHNRFVEQQERERKKLEKQQRELKAQLEEMKEKAQGKWVVAEDNYWSDSRNVGGVYELLPEKNLIIRGSKFSILKTIHKNRFQFTVDVTYNLEYNPATDTIRWWYKTKDKSHAIWKRRK